MLSKNKRGMSTPLIVKPDHFDGDAKLGESGLTLLHPFYGETKRFEKLYEHWNSYSNYVKDNLHVIVVDDCGIPAMDSVMGNRECNFNLSIYRVGIDLKRNTPGALNLGFMVSHTPWILTMDSDCIFKADEMTKMMDLAPREHWVYKFNRLRATDNEHWAKNERFLPCTMLINKELFNHCNGFDEDFTGEYTGGWAYFDSHFDWKVADRGYWAGRMDWIVARWALGEVQDGFQPRPQVGHAAQIWQCRRD